MIIMHALAVNLDVSMHKCHLSLFVTGPVLSHEFCMVFPIRRTTLDTSSLALMWQPLIIHATPVCVSASDLW